MTHTYIAVAIVPIVTIEMFESECIALMPFDNTIGISAILQGHNKVVRLFAIR